MRLSSFFINLSGSDGRKPLPQDDRHLHRNITAALLPVYRARISRREQFPLQMLVQHVPEAGRRRDCGFLRRRAG